MNLFRFVRVRWERGEETGSAGIEKISLFSSRRPFSQVVSNERSLGLVLKKKKTKFPSHNNAKSWTRAGIKGGGGGESGTSHAHESGTSHAHESGTSHAHESLTNSCR